MIHEWRSTGPVGAAFLPENLTKLEEEGWEIFQIDHVGMAKVEQRVVSPNQQSGVMPVYNILSRKVKLGIMT